MGAGSKTKQIVCSRTAELSQSDFKRPTVNLELLDEENSTLPITKAVELVNNCIRLETHEEELKKFKEVGSKTPILPREIGTDPNYKMDIVWFNAIGFVILHIIGLSGALYGVLGLCKIRTSLYCKYINKFNLFSSSLILEFILSFMVNLCSWSRCYNGST